MQRRESIMSYQSLKEKHVKKRMNQAVVITLPGSAALQALEMPEIKCDEVLISVAYEGVCATDLEVLKGSLGFYKNGLADYPIVPGHELSGRIIDKGNTVSNCQIGEYVVVECIQTCGICNACNERRLLDCSDRKELGILNRDGGYAEFVKVPARFVHKLPEGFDLRLATLCEPLAVVLKGLKRLSNIGDDDYKYKICAVIGSGPIGHLCARVLSFWGYQVTAFDRDIRRLSYFKESSIDVTDDLNRINEFQNIIEVTGASGVLNQILKMSPTGAHILLLGLPYSRNQFEFEDVVSFDKAIVGSCGSSSAEFEEAIQLLSFLDLSAYFQCELPLQNFQLGWEKVRRQEHLKVILKIS